MWTEVTIDERDDGNRQSSRWKSTFLFRANLPFPQFYPSSTVDAGKLVHFACWGQIGCYGLWLAGLLTDVYFCPSIGWSLDSRPLPRFCRYAISRPSHLTAELWIWTTIASRLVSLLPHQVCNCTAQSKSILLTRLHHSLSYFRLELRPYCNLAFRYFK